MVECLQKNDRKRAPETSLAKMHSEAHGIATMFSLTDYIREGKYIFT